MTTPDDPMPVFELEGEDLLATPTIVAYRNLCEAYGLHDQANEVTKALAEMTAWQRSHTVKLPNHNHVPAGTPKPAPHVPRRGSNVEAWLKHCRDQYEPNTEPWRQLDELLDDYRLRADTGTDLTAVVGGPGGDD